MVDEVLLRTLTPTVIGILVRRGADFAAAEDAVQDALVEALRVWPDDPPRGGTSRDRFTQSRYCGRLARETVSLSRGQTF
mgnify:CR=1 FL=1